MTGPEHYAVAQQRITDADDCTDTAMALVYATQAQAHATLALAYATAIDPTSLQASGNGTRGDWLDVARS